MRQYSSSILTFTALALLITGCQQDKEQAANQKLEPAKAIIGSWSVDKEASDSALGDEPLDRAKQEAYGQLNEMIFEFTQDKLIVEMETEKQTATYEIVSEGENVLEIDFTPELEGAKTHSVMIKFLDQDRFSLYWPEFPVNTIWTRNDVE